MSSSASTRARRARCRRPSAPRTLRATRDIAHSAAGMIPAPQAGRSPSAWSYAARVERLSIAHVTPHPWGPFHEVNDFIERVSAKLSERGHRVLIAAPSDSRTAIGNSRRAIRAARDKPASLFDGAGDAGGPPVLAVGQGIPMPRGPRPRAAPVPLDVSGTLEQLL